MSLLDRTLSAFGLQRRSLEAASGTKRWPDSRSITSVNSASMQATTAARRALYTTLNNPIAARAVAVYVSNLIGNGIHPRSSHKNERVRNRLHTSFSSFAQNADIRAQRDFAGLQADAVSILVTHGEAFLTSRVVRDEIRQPQLKLTLIHPDQIPRSENRDLPGGGIIRQGIEFDNIGRIVAYHILDHRPDDLRAPTTFTPRRIPAARVAHIFKPIEPGQIRGLSWFAPVLLMMSELDQWFDASLVKQKLSAMYAGILTDPDGTGSPITDASAAHPDVPQLSSGTLISMPPGKDLQFTDPPDAADLAPIAKQYLQLIAAGLGLTYDQLTGDLEKVNFSSIRADTIEFRRMISQVQNQIIIPNFCRPVWRWWIDFEILAGRLSPGQREEYLKVKWLAPKFAYVDPVKDAKADEILYQNHFKSRTEIVAERGYDIEDLDAELAAEQERSAALGLVKQSPQATPDSLLDESESKNEDN